MSGMQAAPHPKTGDQTTFIPTRWEGLAGAWSMPVGGPAQTLQLFQTPFIAVFVL